MFSPTNMKHKLFVLYTSRAAYLIVGTSLCGVIKKLALHANLLSLLVVAKYRSAADWCHKLILY